MSRESSIYQTAETRGSTQARTGLAGLACLSLSLLLVACQGVPTAPEPDAIPPWSPPTGAEAWPVDPGRSSIRIRVARAGPLAQLGHDHVIVGPVEGTVYVGGEGIEDGFDLRLPVAELAVDPPGTGESVSEAARDGTRDNLLGPELLDAEHHPVIRIRSASVVITRDGADVVAEVILRGRLHTLRFPVNLTGIRAGLVITGDLSLTHEELGLEPYSTLGGSLRVAEEMDISFRILARRPSNPAP